MNKILFNVRHETSIKLKILVKQALEGNQTASGDGILRQQLGAVLLDNSWGRYS